MSDSSPQQDRRTVLVVEDEAALRDVLRRYLTAASFEVLAADNVEAAFDLLMGTSVDAVIADVRLRDERSGLEVLQFLRLSDEWHDLPVVMLTGGFLSSEEDEIVRSHRAYVFYKPPDHRELVQKLIQLTRRPRSPLQGVETDPSTEPPAKPTIEGRPTTLWQVDHPDRGTQDCLAGITTDGRVLVRIVQLGKEVQSQIFGDAAAAVQWALELESTLLAQGWEKTI